MESLTRFFDPPQESFFLLGPRGTGKSSWARVAYPDALWIDLLDPETHRDYVARPERLQERLGADPKIRSVVVDEVQRAPELLSVVHGVIEQKKIQFILTGSSARKLRRGGNNLLGGRALVKTLHPFMAAELDTRFNLTTALRIGMVPLIVNAVNPAETLRAYHQLYIREEVLQESLVRNLGQFARFLECISFSHASVLNVSNVAREAQIQQKTAEGFVGILEDLLLAVRVPVFTRRAARATVAHKKFYFFDAGIFRSLRPAGPLDKPQEAEGAALEGLVFQHLRAWNAYRNEPNSIYYWRTRSGSEVDFVLYGKDGMYGIEVKNAKKVRPEDLTALKSFQRDYPEATVLLLYRGADRLKVDGVLCLPCEEFLHELRPSRANIVPK